MIAETSASRALRWARPSAARWACFLMPAVAVLACGCVSPVSADEPAVLRQRQERVERLTVDEKQDLRRKLNRFNSLPEEERRRMRALAAAVEQQPDAAQLRQVLARYDDWLNQLSSTERHQLLILDGSDRFERIKARRGEVLSDSDREIFAAWLERGIFNALPRDDQTRIEKLPPQQRRAETMDQWWALSRRRKQWRPNDEDFDKLKGSLSELARQRLDSAIESGEQEDLFRSWSRQLFWRFWRDRDRRHGGKTERAEVSDETLDHYFEEELSESMRAELISLPADEMKLRLRWQYERDHPEEVERRPSGGKAGPDGRRDHSRRRHQPADS